MQQNTRTTLADKRQARIQQLGKIDFPADLPVVARRQELKEAIQKYQVVLVCGETGSGKTTQLPKICLELGRGIAGCIGHTQPRRVAARSVANRIAQELKCELGGVVGYKVRFNDKVSPDTSVKLMTDGILLAEIHSDPLLKRYDTLIIDEAHERSLNIDFLLGYLKNLLPRRPDLKVIITSATLDAERFAKHFGAHIVSVEGRSYPVEIRYRPLELDEEGEVVDVPQGICLALDEFAHTGLNGDILVFLPGEREIRETAEALRKHVPPSLRHHGLEILPLYSRLSAAEQDKVFKPSGKPRIVLATNVAETSLTVPNIAYVVDCGLARMNRYSVRQKVEQLHIEKISQAAANQRAGRSGRVMSGVCVRLYDEQDFIARPNFTDPEIFRVSLATVILRMCALDLGEVSEFPFLEPPTARMISDGYNALAELGAIDEQRALTSLGKSLAKLPLDPKIARLILAGKQYLCLSEIAIIASALSIQDPRDRPQDKQEQADAAHLKFVDERSDFLAFLKIWAWYEQAMSQQKSRRKIDNFCREHFLSPLRLREWRELYLQIHTQLTEMGMRFNEQPASYDQIHKALLCGLISNIGMKNIDTPEYLGARGIKFWIAPNSVLAKKGCKWVLAGNLMETNRLYARCVARIQPEWLAETGEHLIKRSYFDPHWSKKSAQVCAYERSTLYGLVINPKLRVHYGPMNEKEAREIFIRQALVEGEFETRAPFFAHNQKLIRDIELLEHKSRRPDILVDDELIFAFYDSKIPDGLHNGASFERWRKDIERESPKLLFLQKDDLMRHEAAGITTDSFPPQLRIDNISFSLAYNFAPGRNNDGVTMTIPQALLNQVSSNYCEWLVPGLLAEKIIFLVKTLPQKLRRHLVPVPEFANQFCEGHQAEHNALLAVLVKYIREQKKIDVPVDAFRVEQLPMHLLMNFRVIDEHGRQLEMSRNLAALQSRWAIRSVDIQQGKPLAEETAVAEKEECYSEWCFANFKYIREVTRAGQKVTVYNALVDVEEGVVLRYFDTREQAHKQHLAGLRRLFRLQFKEQIKNLAKSLPELQKLAMLFIPFGNQQDLLDQILHLTLERCCLVDPLPESSKEFEARLKTAKSKLLLVAQELARLLMGVLTEYHALNKVLPQLKVFNRAQQDIQQQLQWLLRKQFVAETPYERLQHLPRYLQAINMRIEKLRQNPSRDSQIMDSLSPLVQAWQKQFNNQESDPRFEEFGWLLQELRVSLFAQQLKTPVIVSVKRLEKMLAGL